MLPTLTFLEDEAAVAVFADALASMGDPRGTLTHLQLAREARPLDRQLEKAEAQHLALHAKALLGTLSTATAMLELGWRRGFVLSVTFSSQLTDAGWSPTRVATGPRKNRLPRLVRELGVLPVMSRLERLEVTLPWSTFCVRHLFEAFEETLALELPSLVEVRIFAWRPNRNWEGVDQPELGRVWAGGRQYRLDPALMAAAKRLVAGRMERLG